VLQESKTNCCFCFKNSAYLKVSYNGKCYHFQVDLATHTMLAADIALVDKSMPLLCAMQGQLLYFL